MATNKVAEASSTTKSAGEVELKSDSCNTFDVALLQVQQTFKDCGLYEMLVTDGWTSRAQFEECLEEMLFHEFPFLEDLASKVRYPHFPTCFENVLRAKFGDDCTLGEQHEQLYEVTYHHLAMIDKQEFHEPEHPSSTNQFENQ